ncbi:MAG: hypothetical protein K0Q72_2538 [Armatimonadetes bacterium]|jgi:hypothetical protein|nr:hypothetical protein [Armatimonadota bacterium]
MAITADRNRRRNAARWIVFGTLGIVLVSGGALVAFYRSVLPQQVQRLPDGSTIGLLGYTFGDAHRFPIGAPVQRMLYRMVSDPLRSQLQMPTHFRMNPAPNSLILWAEQSGADIAFRPDVHLVTVDENGEEIAVCQDEGPGAYGLSGELPNKVRLTTPFSLDTFPRRAPAVRARIYLQRNGRYERAAEFQVPNPDLGPHPRWVAPPLPVRQRRDDFEFSLVSFKTGVRQYRQKGPIPPGELPWTQADFKILRSGKPAPGWYGKIARVEDATGNKWTPFGSYDNFRGRVSRSEVYRLKVEFSNDNEFPPSQRWVLRGLPVPAAGSRARRRESRVEDDMEVRLETLAGPGAISYGNGATAWFRVLPPELSSRRLTLLAATDERGRSVLKYDRPSESYPPDDVTFELEKRSDLRRVNLVVGIRKSYLVEFLAQPVAVEP